MLFKNYIILALISLVIVGIIFLYNIRKNTTTEKYSFINNDYCNKHCIKPNKDNKDACKETRLDGKKIHICHHICKTGDNSCSIDDCATKCPFVKL